MDRYIHRSHPVPDYSVQLFSIHIGQRDIVACEERQPRIIILEIQGIPHPFRKLIDKAKQTFIRTVSGPGNQRVFKFKTQIFIFIFLDFYFPDLTILFLDFHEKTRVCCDKPVIEYICYLLTVHSQQQISRLDTCIHCCTVWLDLVDDDASFHLRSHLKKAVF